MRWRIRRNGDALKKKSRHKRWSLFNTWLEIFAWRHQLPRDVIVACVCVVHRRLFFILEGCQHRIRASLFKSDLPKMVATEMFFFLFNFNFPTESFSDARKIFEAGRDVSRNWDFFHLIHVFSAFSQSLSNPGKGDGCLTKKERPSSLSCAKKHVFHSHLGQQKEGEKSLGLQHVWDFKTSHGSSWGWRPRRLRRSGKTKTSSLLNIWNEKRVQFEFDS